MMRLHASSVVGIHGGVTPPCGYSAAIDRRCRPHLRRETLLDCSFEPLQRIDTVGRNLRQADAVVLRADTL